MGSTNTHFYSTHLAAPVFLGAAVAEEGAVLGVRQVVVLVANLGADCAHTNTVHHATRVAVVPECRSIH